jgi:Fe-Mn family superoxide dismutase
VTENRRIFDAHLSLHWYPKMSKMLLTSFLSAVLLCLASGELLRTDEHAGDLVAPPYYLLSIRADVYILPILPYEMGDLAPYIDRTTVEAHYYGHHEAYRRRMNVALNAWRESEPTNQLTTQPLIKIMQDLDTVQYEFRTKLQHNLGGFVNHALYWATMAANPNGTERFPTGDLLDEIEKTFGSYFEFKVKFSSAAIDLFGSGYVWLVRDPKASNNNQLFIITTVNQDCPLTTGFYPLLVLDVWEHAYYLQHQYRRVEYITNWWMLTDWNKVEKLDLFWLKASNTNFERDEL